LAKTKKPVFTVPKRVTLAIVCPEVGINEPLEISADFVQKPNGAPQLRLFGRVTVPAFNGDAQVNGYVTGIGYKTPEEQVNAMIAKAQRMATKLGVEMPKGVQV
jgi:hypothetical protein